MLIISPAQLMKTPNPLPPKSDTYLPRVVAPISVLLALTLTTYGLRMWVRVTRRIRLGWEDAVITLSVLLATACCSVDVTICVITRGRHLWYVGLPVLADVAWLAFMYIFLWLWALTTIKVSICLMLLRIKADSRKWYLGLWMLNGCLVSLCLASMVCYLVACDPIEANWKFEYLLKPGHCWDRKRFDRFVDAISCEFSIHWLP